MLAFLMVPGKKSHLAFPNITVLGPLLFNNFLSGLFVILENDSFTIYADEACLEKYKGGFS